MIQWAAARVPHLVSGSADLEPSTLTYIDDGGAVSKGDYSGRNVHYGVREHGMGAIVNGLNLHGLRAFGSTFFTFSDYMKGAIRLGGDHAPAGDPRVHPRLDRPRRGRADAPADRAAGAPAGHAQPLHGAAGGRQRDRAGLALRARADEHAGARWRSAARACRCWNPSAVPDDAIHRGAYALRESFKDGDPDLILIGTGSEVHICNEAADLLEADGIATRVVSAPCFERFAEQDADYRDGVLPPSVRARVSVEAAATFGWERWTTDDGEPGRHDRLRRLGPAARAVRALRLHARERGRPRRGRSLERAGRHAHERRGSGQPAARGAHGRRHERLARPDPAQPDRRAASSSG